MSNCDNGYMWDLLKYSASTALQDDKGNALTYGQLSEAAGKFGEAVGKRCLVFILCTNSIGSVTGYVSCIQDRIVPVMLSARMETNLIKRLISLYSPEYLWIPEGQKEEDYCGEVVYSDHGYCLVSTGCGKSPKLYEELALLLSTSGSTGSPKFVRQSYRNIFSNAASIAQYLKLDKNERPITTLPMSYTYGLSIINSHLLVGADILLTDSSVMQREFWNFFKSAEATSFGGVPYTYEMLDKMRFFGMKLPSLKTMTQAGGKISLKLHEKYAQYAMETGKEFIVMYGQCEATARMSYLPADQAAKKTGSIGIAIPGGKLRLVDMEGREITEAGVEGELVYSGDNVTLGYAERKEDLVKRDERNGILHTGDLARRDEDGYFYIVGRIKRFLKIFGNRVNLDETDHLINDHFKNVEAVSTGIDDHMVIFITKKGIEEEVLEFVSETTGLNRSAFKVMFIPEIPKNDSGKILYSQLKEHIQRFTDDV